MATTPRAAGVRGAPERRRGGRTKPPYPLEFKAEAVRLARRGAAPPAQVARELGISPDTLRAWMKQEAVDVGEQAGLTSDERAEQAPARPRGRGQGSARPIRSVGRRAPCGARQVASRKRSQRKSTRPPESG